MSEEKTFSRTYRFSGETIRKLLEVQQQRNFPSITLTLETVIAEAHDALRKRDSLSKTEEKPSADQEVKDQSKEAPEEKPPLQRTQEEATKDLLANRCDTPYLHCVSEPFKDKDGRLHINCPKPIFKQNPHGKWIPSGKFLGKIPIEQCMSMQRYQLEKKQKEITREEQVKETEEAEEEEQEEDLETPEPSIPNKPKQSIDKIVDQLAVCLNPFIMRERPLLCHVCRKKQPDKWQACQEIQRELETSPSAMREFVDNMKAKTIEARKARENPYWFWEESRKTEDMTIQEIEEELGQREPRLKRRSCSEFCTDFKIMNCPKWPSCELNKPVSTSPSYEDLMFDAIQKRYDELCITCEEHRQHRCTRHCKEFFNGLELPKKSEGEISA